MAGEKTFYWLRLKKDFFKRHDIKILRNMDDGDEIVLCYLMLLCESVDHEGRLRFSDAVPYDADMLAAVTDTDPEIMERTIDKLLNLGLMVKEDDGSYFMTKVEKMIGVAQADDQTRESARLRQQAYRDRQKQEKESSSRDSNVTVTLRECDSNVTEPLLSRDSNVIRNGEIEIEKEIDIEIKDNKEKVEKENLCQLVADRFNETCVSFPRLSSLSDARKKAIKARINKYSIDAVFRVFQKAEASSFLKGSNSRDWSATFDWIMTDKNFAKILDGNYDDKEGSRQQAKTKSGNAKADELESFYDMAKRWAEKGDGDE